MTTGINNWVRMEQPELSVGELLGPNVLDEAFELWTTPVTDMRPVRSGPFAVTIGGDDDDVVYFRTAHAANVFAASQIDAPVTREFIGGIDPFDFDVAI